MSLMTCNKFLEQACVISINFLYSSAKGANAIMSAAPIIPDNGVLDVTLRPVLPFMVIISVPQFVAHPAEKVGLVFVGFFEQSDCLLHLPLRDDNNHKFEHRVQLRGLAG